MVWKGIEDLAETSLLNGSMILNTVAAPDSGTEAVRVTRIDSNLRKSVRMFALSLKEKVC